MSDIRCLCINEVIQREGACGLGLEIPAWIAWALMKDGKTMVFGACSDREEAEDFVARLGGFANIPIAPTQESTDDDESY